MSEEGRWSITFADGAVFSEPEWCAIDKFERQRMLLARPPATFRYSPTTAQGAEDVSKESKARRCSFCESCATTMVSDDNDVFDCCKQCEADWKLDPGFCGNSPKPSKAPRP